MKNLIILLFPALLLLGCDFEPGYSPSPQLLMSVSIPNNYYNDVESGHLYLTDQNGNLIIDAALTNDQTTEIRNRFDLDERYDATFLTKETYSDFAIYNIQTFIDVNPHEYTFRELIDPNPNDEQAYLLVRNTPGIFEDINSSHSFTGGAGASTFEADLFLKRIPDKAFLSFEHNNELYKRYLFLEGLTGASRDTFDYQELPLMDQALEINYPANEQLRVSIDGGLASEPDIFYPLSQSFLRNGSTTSTHELPPSLFDRYRTVIYLENNGVGYLTNEITESVTLNHVLPDMDFSITQTDPENYEILSDSDYDFHFTRFEYDNFQEGYRVRWVVHGTGNPTVRFSIPKELEELIFEDNPNFSLQNLTADADRIYRIEGLTTYEEYVSYFLDPNSEVEEKITKMEYVNK